jgi:hypothetical protein
MSIVSCLSFSPAVFFVEIFSAFSSELIPFHHSLHSPKSPHSHFILLAFCHPSSLSFFLLDSLGHPPIPFLAFVVIRVVPFFILLVSFIILLLSFIILLLSPFILLANLASFLLCL